MNYEILFKNLSLKGVRAKVMTITLKCNGKFYNPKKLVLKK
jgi:hypothetical protein